LPRLGVLSVLVPPMPYFVNWKLVTGNCF